MNVPRILLAKKGAPTPQLKLTCVSASGKTRPFAPTVRADFNKAHVRKIQQKV